MPAKISLVSLYRRLSTYTYYVKSANICCITVEFFLYVKKNISKIYLHV